TTPKSSATNLEGGAATRTDRLSGFSAFCAAVDIDKPPLSISSAGHGHPACRHAHAPPQSPAAANPVSRSEPWLLALSPRPCPAATPRRLFVPPIRGAAHGAASLLQDVHELALRRREHADEPRKDPLDHAHELTTELLPRRQVGER